MENKLQTLYRFFDSEDNLLYVGVSVNFLARINQHYKNAKFWDEIKYATFEKYETRVEVEAAELKAIISENPIYNKLYNPNWENARMHFGLIRDWVYGKTTKPIDTTHAELIQSIQNDRIRDDAWVRKNSAPVAYWFMHAYSFLDAHEAITCEMCEEIYNKDQYLFMSEYHEEKVNDAIN